MLQPSLVDLDLAKPTSEPARAFRPKKTFRLGPEKLVLKGTKKYFVHQLVTANMMVNMEKKSKGPQRKPAFG